MIPIQATKILPIVPTFNEDIRRQVRWAMAEILQYCGEPVGPKPGEPIHAVAGDQAVFVSPELANRIATIANRPPLRVIT